MTARERRWRFWSPDEASIGAVPFHEAKCAAVANRSMSPMSPTIRTALDGPISLSSPSELPAAATSWHSCLFAALILASMVGVRRSARWPAGGGLGRRCPPASARCAAGSWLGQLEQLLADAVDNVGAGAAQFVATAHQQPQREVRASLAACSGQADRERRSEPRDEPVCGTAAGRAHGDREAETGMGWRICR